MVENTTVYKFLKQFKFFFDKDKYIIWDKGRVFFFRLPSFYCYNKKEKKISFIFFNLFHFKTFLKHIWNYEKRLTSFYFFRIKLKGLGYRVTPLSRHILRLYFNRSNFFYMHISSSILLKYKNRRLIFISTHIEHLKQSMLHLLLLKKQILYRLKGLFPPRQILLKKPGKNKFR